ncbi:hypothetical protein ACFPOB_26275 [Bosea eneae]|uniref:Uncharacterized protein n=1 Tax=Bosea eneae TaxID=151454 RepID=A0ABW0IXK3_9HYPH
MWLLPWRSGVARQREQRAASMDRLMEASARRIDVASAENAAAAREMKGAVARRNADVEPLRPILAKLLSRLRDDHHPHR